MSVFVPPFSPVYLLPNVTFPVTETQIMAKELDKNGSPLPSRELVIESVTYDLRGQVVMNQAYTVEVWA